MKSKSKKKTKPLYRLSAQLPANTSEAHAAAISEALAGLADASVFIRADHNDASPWALEWIFQVKPDPAEAQRMLDVQIALGDTGLTAPVLSFAEIPADFDWLQHSYRQFPPFSVGDFFVHGSHHDGVIPDGQLGLQIDAATAFGSGEHGTTAGCLEALLHLNAQGVCPWNVLDMGTGSGILGIAAWKLWKTPVLAVDNDPEATRVAQHHAHVNKIPAGSINFTAVTGDGFYTPEVQQKKPFDLIIANILAGPLRDMAPDLKAVCDQTAYVVLSGILHAQAENVIEAYRVQGIILKKRIDLGEWSTLVLQNSSS